MAGYITVQSHNHTADELLQMATIDGRPISFYESLMVQEVASIFELRIKNAGLDNDIAKLERVTGLADYEGLRALRVRLEGRQRNRQEHLRDLRNLYDKIAKVTNEYEDGDGDGDSNDPYTLIRPDDGKNGEVSALDEKVSRLKNEYLKSRNRASVKGQRSAEGR